MSGKNGQKAGGPELPEPVRVPSDSCIYYIGEQEYHIHAGQAVWLFSKPTARQQLKLWRYRNRQVELDEVEPPPIPDDDPSLSDEENVKRISEALKVSRKGIAAGYGVLGAINHELFEVFAELFARWDWTDMKGQPRPPLDGTIEPYEDLLDVEIAHLVSVILGGVSADLPNVVNSSAISAGS